MPGRAEATKDPKIFTHLHEGDGCGFPLFVFLKKSGYRRIGWRIVSFCTPTAPTTKRQPANPTQTIDVVGEGRGEGGQGCRDPGMQGHRDTGTGLAGTGLAGMMRKCLEGILIFSLTGCSE